MSSCSCSSTTSSSTARHWRSTSSTCARVLDALREQKLYAKESKCEFFKHEVEFLGHIESAGTACE